MNSKVCILTAGRGTRMGIYSEIINKALLPINRKAAISHIIDRFPADTEFVIGVGFLKEQVKNYLATAHPDIRFTYAEVDNYDGPGSGPGHSLLCCSPHLQGSFYFLSCDTLFSAPIDPSLTEDWFGVATVPASESENYCNFEIQSGRVVAIRDKQRVDGPEYKAFVGLCHIKDYSSFWKGLSGSENIKGESQVSKGISAVLAAATKQKAPLALEVGWTDIGTLQKYKEEMSRYESYDFSKTNEFLYIVGGKVIKIFADRGITEKRVRKARLGTEVFPEITDHRDQFYAYNLQPGKTFYEESDPGTFAKLLAWLDQKLWLPKKVDSSEMQKVCRDFYYAKTTQRLKAYYEKYDLKDGPSVVNGVSIPSTASLMELVPWEKLYDGKAVFMHGDLQFDNILYDRKSDRFTLLDWRQDFGGHVEFGDMYYDLAKLYGGIVLNYIEIKANHFSYSESPDSIRYALPPTEASYLAQLEEYIVSKGMDVAKVRTLVGIIYLNMSPLHHYPFDKMLYSLSRATLAKELG